MRKTEGLVKYTVIFLKPIRTQYYLMVVIFKIPLKTWPWQQCVPVPLNIMEMCVTLFLINSQIFSYPVRRKIKIQQTRVQQ